MKKWMTFLCLGFLLLACEKDNRKCESEIEKQFDLTGFTKIEAGGTFRLQIEKGNSFSIVAKGCAEDIADLQMELANLGTLQIDYSTHKNHRGTTEVKITLPQINSVILSGAARGSIYGFAGQPSVIRHILSGVAECEVTGTGINAQFELSGTSTLNISGDTESLFGVVSGDSRLNGYETNANEVDIYTSGRARAYVKPLQIIYAEASGESQVFYRGNPPVKHTSTTGNGKVIHE